MNRVTWWNPRLGSAGVCLSLLVLHSLLCEVLARFDIVSSIFAAGSHVPTWMIACAGLFAVVRLAVILMIPAIVVGRLVLFLADPSSRHGSLSRTRGGGL